LILTLTSSAAAKPEYVELKILKTVGAAKVT
jgi:hypothetical protein